jgi:hypothetical protein
VIDRLVARMHAFVFIDTNVPLHFRFFDEIDWPHEVGVDHVNTRLRTRDAGRTRRERNGTAAAPSNGRALPIDAEPGLSDREPAPVLFNDAGLSTRAVNGAV